MTPEQEEQVRRALASTPAAGPVPPEVAARLEDTLAGLVAERSDAPPDAGSPPARVIALEERRRRRWPRLLVAAAGISVLAYGAGIALDGLQVSGGSADSASAGKPAMDSAGAGAGTDSVEGGSEAAPGDAPTALVPDRNGAQVPGSRVRAYTLIVPGTVRLHRDTLDQDVRRLLDDPQVTNDRAPQKTRSAAGVLDSCELPDVGRGDRLAAVRLDGRPGTLVIRKATAGTRVAEVYSCGDGGRLWALTRVRTAR